MGPWKGEHIGLTCAACHNAQLNYKGKRIRIDGGVGNTFDLMAYIIALDDALQATLADAAKFDRLAARMGATSADAKSELRKRFEKDATPIHNYRTRTIVTPATAGPSRMDAIALIVNRLTTVRAQHSGELDHADRADQAALPVERTAGLVDAVARRAAGPDRAQPDRDHGRVHVDEPARQDTGRRAVRFQRRDC